MCEDVNLAVTEKRYAHKMLQMKDKVSYERYKNKINQGLRGLCMLHKGSAHERLGRKMTGNIHENIFCKEVQRLRKGTSGNEEC